MAASDKLLPYKYCSARVFNITLDGWAKFRAKMLGHKLETQNEKLRICIFVQFNSINEFYFIFDISIFINLLIYKT